MFDVGLSELMVIAVVALIVIGPERLPKVARTLGHLWGRAQRYINGVKADISRDMALEELRQMQQKVQQEANAANQVVKQTVEKLDQQAHQLNAAIIQPESVTQRPSTEPPSVNKVPEQQKFMID